MECRSGCGACCIVPAIHGAFYGMPAGKPAGVPCVHLDAQLRCRLFGRPERPAFCTDFTPEPEVCGASREEAVTLLGELERQSRPPAPAATRPGPASG